MSPFYHRAVNVLISSLFGSSQRILSYTYCCLSMEKMFSFNRILLLAIAILFLVLSHECEVCNAHIHHPHHFHHPRHPSIGVFLGAQIDCKGRCHMRCSLASRYRVCLRACNTCCQRCNCVPPGTAGNANVCPCWANMTTKGGRKKCP